ncbi:putative transcription factor lepB [Lachnellula suecica]|uniref:Putative transcription factor lepB n=1 Tax=Lachnellula suecica TaxID=602035 RepID=A0A8T9CIZ8_9HELO|nr:putative transcription factor lepB [Lachnellula suecica]
MWIHNHPVVNPRTKLVKGVNSVDELAELDRSPLLGRHVAQTPDVRRVLEEKDQMPENNTMRELHQKARYRGAAHLCRRADVIHSVERQTPHMLHTLSPTSSGNVPVTMGNSIEPVLNEKVLGLVTSLSDRVNHLEEKLDALGPGKRSFHPDEGDGFLLGLETPSSSSIRRPQKQSKISREEMSHVSHSARHSEVNGESDYNSSQPAFDPEVEDAATVLEFLAWGRLKDSNITTGLRDTSGVNDSALSVDKDIIQATQAWGLSPSSIAGSQSLDILQMSQVQDMVPSKAQALLLLDYHADWLLFMHSAFHVQTLKQELEKFYLNDHGMISMTSPGLQWAALLFAVLCGSMTCARPTQIRSWGFPEDRESKLVGQTMVSGISRMSPHCQIPAAPLFVQAIASSTICAHILGFSNSHSVMLASAVRIAQALGLHRLGKPKRTTSETVNDGLAERVQKELGRRVWQELTTQDWFSVPFSETYCINPLHFSSEEPLHCDEETMQPVSPSKPTITSYGNFLFRVAHLMPGLLDRSSKARSVLARYEEVLRFDQMMRELVMSELPTCLNSQTLIDPQWPRWLLLSRRCLTITSAHKIIMIHRNFLGMSFHDKQYAFTRKNSGATSPVFTLEAARTDHYLACLAAAKTIINEVKQDFPDESPILWTMQAFSVAAAIILSLDNFSRHPSSRERAEHRILVSDAIEILSGSVTISSIAARGTRLLTELLAEDEKHSRNADPNRDSPEQKEKLHGGNNAPRNTDKSLNVAAFVKKFCESDQPPPGNSPIATSHMPLWLQQDTSFQTFWDNRRGPEDIYTVNSRRSFATSNQRPPTLSTYDTVDSTTGRRHHEVSSNQYMQSFPDPSFDIRSANWFGDLQDLAPSHSI